MSFRTSRIIAVAAAFVAAAGVAPGGQARELDVEGRAGANASIAASGRFVAVAWGAAAKDGPTGIYTAVSRDAGRTFGRPTRASDDRSQASLSGEQPPRVTLVPRAGQDPSIVVVWTSRAASGTRLLSARSDDGGRSFARPSVLPGSAASGNRGWEATATDRDGRTLAIWLDHRGLAMPVSGPAAPMNHAEHQHGAQAARETDGVARAQLSKLFFARLDEAKSGREITGGVCYCCKTTLAAGTDGAIYAAWRHVYPGNIRDIAFTMSRDGGRTFAPPIRVSEDRWVLDGCPENGPALTVDRSGSVHVVWPTLVAGPTPGSEPTLALFYAMSRDGRRFTPRQRIPTEGVPRHVQIAVAPDGAVVMAWDEGADGARRIAVAAGARDASGRLTWRRRIVSGNTTATYPVLAASEGGMLAAWTRGADRASVGHSVIHVERVMP